MKQINLEKNIHLVEKQKIQLGSYYSPKKIVQIAKKWVMEEIKNNAFDHILDLGVGYGSFINEFLDSESNFIATDIDEFSVNFIKENFPNISIYKENSLIKVNRRKYKIEENEKILIIGNPPYNDTLSQYQKNKKGSFEMDENLVSNDLGLSFLKMYNELKADLICVIHPLSFLIKKQNFNKLKSFFQNYKLEKSMIFSSKEFEQLKNRKTNEFPLILSLYKRQNNIETNYEDILKFKFNIFNHQDFFILNNFNTIDSKIHKYPFKTEEKDILYFYTLRDINSLIRNKTFLSKKINNAIAVSIENLYKYCWLDFCKNNYSNLKNKFLYSNLSPLYTEMIENDSIKKMLVSWSLLNNQTFKEFVQNNNLEDKIKKFYNIDNLEINFKKLDNIFKSTLTL
ncbi:methyltransferase [Mycoplasma sp. 1012]